MQVAKARRSPVLKLTCHIYPHLAVVCTHLINSRPHIPVAGGYGREEKKGRTGGRKKKAVGLRKQKMKGRVKTRRG